ncbi:MULTISPECIES: hypothetical protein [Asticcacaulis]|jgi:hypothetical protein|uniref:hypothetical protein n=1 Tax=Asticcacaulis TaxID=76890 RepID=UPI001AE2EE82|nr:MULTISPECIES: hypothetical protein [Asticcacaulis]MBP2160556.1 hypothetical protein [Asticcacaulis solisilvae]MDR6801601.1 hypothetical protein [Asticcacaulis sp. BE141]
MHARLIKAVSMIAGLLALLLCMAAPAMAGSAAHHGTQVSAAMADMPCCPQKAPATAKACGQQCPMIAQADFRFEHAVRAIPLRFDLHQDDFASLSYSPQAPPPR